MPTKGTINRELKTLDNFPGFDFCGKAEISLKFTIERKIKQCSYLNKKKDEAETSSSVV